ncbi:hypothetical protein [Sporosarcina sp. P33]|uniref:hypothetical protein n=1 Tax=Sporosarcina sp. P33 TaxID=1930764 RepID=UPI0009C12166|nr:hypothetical protein [Sporosarcina sp. P33]ARD48837.1 hypothetical protein SporoP33_11785 [Sporosarcina sp. P33]
MKIIQHLSDIEYLKSDNELPLPFIKEIEQDFLNAYEAVNHEDIYLLNFYLPLGKALFVFEKGDDVLAKLNDPFALEYVEAIKLDAVKFYRCALRGESLQLYYSPLNTHDRETEEWLREQAEWNEGMSDS